MKGATCPACGVAVLPGYARCPNKRCRKPLPRRLPTQVEGGTAVSEETKRWPLFAAIGAALVGTIAIIMLGRGDDKPAPAPPVQPTEQPTVAPVAPVADDRGPVLDNSEPTPTQPTGPDPAVLASTLQNDLKRQRLWASVSIDGSRVEVRSGSCSDPAMGPILDGAAAGFKSAGLTKLRCVEQSGRVVTDRDL